jgi:hypothetical protein
MCFLSAGLFLLVFSDTEIWPCGPQTPWYAVTHNPEDLQHKLFAIILLAVGFVELQRAKGRFRAPWIGWFFPVVGGAGAVLLLFHVHSGDMQAPHAMETMEDPLIQRPLFIIWEIAQEELICMAKQGPIPAFGEVGGN